MDTDSRKLKEYCLQVAPLVRRLNEGHLEAALQTASPTIEAVEKDAVEHPGSSDPATTRLWIGLHRARFEELAGLVGTLAGELVDLRSPVQAREAHDALREALLGYVEAMKSAAEELSRVRTDADAIRFLDEVEVGFGVTPEEDRLKGACGEMRRLARTCGVGAAFAWPPK